MKSDDRYKHLLFFDTFSNSEKQTCYYFLEVDRAKGLRATILTPVIHKYIQTGYSIQQTRQGQSQLVRRLVDLAEFIKKDCAQTRPSCTSTTEPEVSEEESRRTLQQLWNYGW